MVFSRIKEEGKEEFGLELEKFLEAFHGENSFEIRFISGTKSGRNNSILKYNNQLFTNNENRERVLLKNYSTSNLIACIEYSLQFCEDASVYFIVNSPNPNELKSCEVTNESIIKGGSVNAQFVDIDAPKDIRHDDNLLNLWKKGIKDNILCFVLRPSIVVETKNGYHVYWLLEEGNHSLFREIQMQLVEYFEGDRSCINEARVLRMPYFSHLKDPTKPYTVRNRIFEPTSRYSQQELIDVLPLLKEEVRNSVLNKSEDYDLIDVSNHNSADIKSLLLEKLRENVVRVKEDKITLHCCMPNHEDRNPSAWIDTNYFWYHCSSCESSKSLIDLANELNWKDFIELWNRYEIDIVAELNFIQEELIDVEELEHLKMNSDDERIVNTITSQVFKVLASYGQIITEHHKQSIKSSVQILYKSKKGIANLISLEMGGGKSLIVKEFLKHMSTLEEFGAIVVLERIEDVLKIANEINTSLDKKVAFPMYGFTKEECLLNNFSINKYNSCIARKGKRCSYTNQCRFYMQSQNQIKYPILVITSKRLSLRSEHLSDYAFFNKEEEEHKRKHLIIDEKPEMIYVETFNRGQLELLSNSILEKIDFVDFEGNEICYQEFKNVMEKVGKLYESEKKQKLNIVPLESNFAFSSEFFKTFLSIFDYIDEEYKMVLFIQYLMRNGGHRSVSTSGEVSFTTSAYNSYDYFRDFKTVIFDGTADIDIEYRHQEMNVFRLPQLKTFDDLTFYICNFSSAAKTRLKSIERLEAFCNDTEQIILEHPKEKVFLPVFKNNRPYVEGYFEKYVESGSVQVAHYGSTKGSNKYNDCSTVILGGILHKGEDYYIAKAKAIFAQREECIEDLSSTNIDKTRKFNDKRIEMVKILDMLVDYSQEIKRSNQRDISKSIEGKVYVFHNDKILLEAIDNKFPSCNKEQWLPKNIIINDITSKKYNTIMKAFCEYVEDNSERNFIPLSEIKKSLNISKQQFSNLLKNANIINFLNAVGYVKAIDEQDKRKTILIKR